MKSKEEKFIHSCLALLGNNAVLTEKEQKKTYLTDWRKRYTGKACCVLLPENTKQVADIVKLAREYCISLVPQGGNTGLSGGATPSEKGNQALLSLKRLGNIRYIDSVNQTIAVDSGCILTDVQKFAEKNNLYFPLALGSEGSCTIGGNLATNAGGVNVLHYGNARSLCLGLEVVLSSGEIWDGMKQLHKDNSGYALKEIFIGSEGTLGVITGAVLKLFPKPLCFNAFIALNSFEASLYLIKLLRSQICTPLTGFEIISNAAIQVVTQHYPSYVSILEPGFSSSSDAPYFALIECVIGKMGDMEKTIAENKQNIIKCLSDTSEKGLLKEAWIAQNNQQAENFWKIRESIPLAQAKNGLNVKHDISLPISMIQAFLKNVTQRLSKTHPQARIIHFGHLGDGNLHFNVSAPSDSDACEFLKKEEKLINQCVYEEVSKCHGSFSAEHGIGQFKTDLLVKYKSSSEINLMKKLKQAWDPDELFNPGKLQLNKD